MKQTKKILLAAALLSLLAGGAANAEINLNGTFTYSDGSGSHSLTGNYYFNSTNGTYITDRLTAEAYSAIYKGHFYSTGETMVGYSNNQSGYWTWAQTIGTGKIGQLATALGGDSLWNYSNVPALFSNIKDYNGDSANITSFYDAANTVYRDVNQLTADVGTLTEITDTTLIGSETTVTGVLSNLNTKVGDVSTLKNKDKIAGDINLVNAINELDKAIGTGKYVNGGTDFTSAVNLDTKNIAGTDGQLSLTNKATSIKGAIDANTALIGGTGTNGALVLSNQQDTVEKGINRNTTLIAGSDGTLTLSNMSTGATIENGIQRNTDLIGGTGTDAALELLSGAANDQGVQTVQAGINYNTRAIRALSAELGKGLAKSAALAGLHPEEFDPAAKLSVSAATGSYKSQTANAIGLFYRPNRDVMISVGTTVSDADHDSYNVGITVKAGRTKAAAGNADAEKISSLIAGLEAELAAQDSEIAELEAAQGR